MSRSEVVAIESLEVREHLRFVFYLDILNKLLLLQWKHSKYMYEFFMFYEVFDCIRACVLHVLSVRLTKVSSSRGKICSSFFQKKLKRYLNCCSVNFASVFFGMLLLIFRNFFFISTCLSFLFLLVNGTWLNENLTGILEQPHSSKIYWLRCQKKLKN